MKKRKSNRLLALLLVLTMSISLGQSVLATEIIEDGSQTVTETASEATTETIFETQEKNSSETEAISISAEESKFDDTCETSETVASPVQDEETSLKGDLSSNIETSVIVANDAEKPFEEVPSNSLQSSFTSLTFDGDSYSGSVGDVINITATYVGPEPTCFYWDCFTLVGGKPVKNAISFSTTSTAGPAVTGEANTWWISVAATVMKEGTFNVKLTARTKSGLMASAETSVTVKEAVVSRYTVLILDASWSMNGTPEKVQREAAIKFCEAVSSASADDHIAIVSMDSDSYVSCNFTTELDTLTNCIQNITANGGTDMTGALTIAQSLLGSVESEQGTIKNIVLCSDGEPNSVSSAKSSASTIKNEGITVYTLGFFHNLSGSSLESARQLMIEIASSEECYYEVADADNLEFNFLGIAKDITVEPVSIAVGYSTYVPLTDGIVQYHISALITNNSKSTQLTNLFVQLDEGDQAEILTEYGEWSQKTDTLAAGASIEFNWVISLNVAQAYPDGGAHSVIVYAGSDQTVTTSAQGSIAVDAINRQSNELDFSKDVWSFHNYSDENGHMDVINEDDQNVLLAGLSASDRATLVEILKTTGQKGHCFGMSLTAILSKMNIFDVSQYAEATILRKAEKTDRIMSILCYYQVLQHFDSFISDFQEFMNEPVTEQLSLLANRADEVKSGGTPVLLSFGADEEGDENDWTHAVVAYATETGLWEFNGITYNKRILIYDCNAANDNAVWDFLENPIKNPNPIWNEDHCLYFNAGTDQWTIPYYYGDSADDCDYLKRACNDLAILDTRNYDSGRYNFIAELGAQNETAMRMENSKSEYIISGKSGSVTGDTDLITYHDCAANGEKYVSDLHVVLPDENDRYILSTLSGKAEELDFYINDENLFLSVEASSATGSSFSINRGISLIGNKGRYELKLADDYFEEGDYNTYVVSGDKEGDISIEVVDEGIMISGDNLEDIRVIGSDSSDEAEIVFSTDEDNVLVMGDEDNSKLIVLADTDGDSNYETILAEGEEDNDNDNGENDGNDTDDNKDNNGNNGVVTIPPVDNGSVTLTPSNPAKGDTVTITVNPDEGYQLSKMTVTDDKGKKISLIDNGDGTYSFIMPEGNVKIDALFKAAKTEKSTEAVDSDGNSNSVNRTDSVSISSPYTGDNTHMSMWLIILFASGIGLIMIVLVKKRSRSQE